MSTAKIWQHPHYQDLFQSNAIRPGSEPRLIDHEEVQENAIVLLHGLTDSPYFMEAIGLKFYEMGFNVIIPLLPGHGLKDPRGMRDVRLEDWQNEVHFAVDYAKTRGKKVSIGGLSTGGVLSVWKAMTDSQDIQGGLFLFSAALDLAGATGNLAEGLLRTRFLRPIISRRQDMKEEPLVGDDPDDNPYRYSRMDLDGAAQLSKVIKNVEDLVKKNIQLSQPLFVAHSEYDSTADINEVEKFINNHRYPETKTEFFRIGEHFHVPHASVVLATPVFATNQSPLEPANPFFDLMMNAAHLFIQKHL